ncbi:9989_t:CDS:2 [Funneliformis caledonium]|uniref:9989_t:CDS:1 n=1 Tax=Funneliformis caledonium TaxID=1117310 RepID=A0A9N9G2X0_9GLOM|nr:9989_t:CDS:2 [Funneliformis caledonium]
MTLSSRNRMNQNDSLIIGPKHFAIINNWIVGERNLPYTLLYRGSRDGIISNVLKDKCYRQSPCLVLVKVRSSPKIFGGYSPIGIYFCTGGQWHRTSAMYMDNDKNLHVKYSQNYQYNLGEFASNYVIKEVEIFKLEG